MAVGDAKELTRVADAGDVAEFIDSIGDHNPIHHDYDYAATTRFAKPIVPGMWTAGLISAVLGTQLPGPGAIYVSQQITFTRPVYFGDTITARVKVVERMLERRRVRLRTVCVNQRDEDVLVGEALLSPPKSVVTYTERKVGSAALTQLALQPWLWTAQAAGAWARMNTSLFAAWRTTQRIQGHCRQRRQSPEVAVDDRNPCAFIE